MPYNSHPGREHDASHIRNPIVGAHEHRDANVRGVWAFLATLTVAAIVIQLLLWGLFVYFRGSYRSLDPEPNPMLSGQRPPPVTDPARDFPRPRLQADPAHDRNSMEAAEDQALHGPPAYLNDQGTVRIPIGQAMKLTVERGLPVLPAPAAPRPQPAQSAPAAPPRSDQ